MPTPKRRSYDDACAAAHALDLIGDRWALLVVRELLLGPKRFTDLRAGLPNASPNVLAQRLRELEGVGVVRRRKLPPPAASRVYELTEWGMELEPVIISLGRWGARSPSKPRDVALGVDSLILSLRTMFDARRSGRDRCDLRAEVWRGSLPGGGWRRPLRGRPGERGAARGHYRDRCRDAGGADLRGRLARRGAGIRGDEDRRREGGGGALPHALPAARAGCPRHRQGIARTIAGLRRGGGESSPSGGADLAYATGAERRYPGHDGRRAPRALRWRAVRPGWDHRAGRPYRGASAGRRRRAGHERPDLVARLREHPPPPRPDADPRAPGRPGHQPLPLAPGPLPDLGPPDSRGVSLEHPRWPRRARRLRLHYRLRSHLRLPERLPDRRPDLGGPGDRRAVPRLSRLHVPGRVPGRVAAG